jgi:hypothetical protein
MIFKNLANGNILMINGKGISLVDKIRVFKDK